MMRLLIRVDANARIGWGHLMRCLTLAEAMRHVGGGAVFVVRAEPSAASAIQLVRRRGFSCLTVNADATAAADQRFTRAVVQSVPVQGIVLDGYHFTVDDQQTLSINGLMTILFDDLAHLPRYACDVLINSNPAAHALQYATGPDTLRLFGPAYVPVRSDVVRRRRSKREVSPHARRVLVTLGGGDATAISRKVLSALASLRDPRMVVELIVGPANPRRDALEKHLAQLRDSRLHLIAAVEDLPARMAAADLAISASGGTLWELACLGVPALALTLADNQRPIAEYLRMQGGAIELGDAEKATVEQIARATGALLGDAPRRAALSAAALATIDGRGADRIVASLGDRQLQLRRAEPQDALLLWHWANEPETREASFSTAAIPWSDHVTWFRRQIDREDALLLIACGRHGEPLGQVRFQRRAAVATASISVDKGVRGQGVGKRLIRAAVAQVFAQWPDLERVEAEVKPANLSSRRLFEAAGFKLAPPRERAGNTALVFLYGREQS